MKVTVFGTKKYDFTDNRTGAQKVGITAHYTCLSNNSNVKGLEYGKFGCAIENDYMYSLLNDLSLPCELDLEFNRYGNVIDFKIL